MEDKITFSNKITNLYFLITLKRIKNITNPLKWKKCIKTTKINFNIKTKISKFKIKIKITNLLKEILSNKYFSNTLIY